MSDRARILIITVVKKGLGDIVIEIRPIALIPSVFALVTRNVIDF